VVLDPFMGSGTTAAVAKRLGRRYIGFELNPEYVMLAMKRLRGN
jgi:DNA modification methylase